MQTPATQQLDLVERQFNQVAAFLAAGDAPHLQAAAAMLQVLSVELQRLLPAQNHNQSPNSGQTRQGGPASQAELRRRVLAMAKGLQVLRDNLSRQSAYNQQALQVVMPAPPKSTYAGGSPVYGAVARQGGVHRFLAA